MKFKERKKWYADFNKRTRRLTIMDASPQTSTTGGADRKRTESGNRQALSSTASTFSLDGCPFPIAITSKFQSSQFIEQFIIHIFLPFSIVYVLWKDGFHVVMNQRLLPNKLDPGALLLTTPYSIMATVILLFFNSELLTDHGFQVPEFLMTLVLLVGHRLMVALKYAYCAREEYRWFKSQTGRSEAAAFMRHKQLLTGWMLMNEFSLREQLTSAQLRTGVDLSKVHFKIPSHNQSQRMKWKHFLENVRLYHRTNMLKFKFSWKEFFKQGTKKNSLYQSETKGILGEVEDNDGVSNSYVESSNNAPAVEGLPETISGIQYCEALITYCTTHNALSLRWYLALGLILAAILVCTPGIIRIALGFPFLGSSVLANAMIACNMFNACTLFVTLFMFFVVLFNDFTRRAYLNRRLGKMLKVDQDQLFHGSNIRTVHKYPGIEVRDPTQVQAWTLCKTVLNDFGAPIQARLNNYLVGSAVTLAAGLFILLVRWAQNFSSPQVLRTETGAILCIYLVLVFGASSLAAVALGSSVNDEAKNHIYLFAANRVQLGWQTKVRRESCDVSGFCPYDIRASDSLLEASISLFETMADLEPLKFLGKSATKQTAGSGAVIMFSGIAILVKEIFL